MRAQELIFAYLAVTSAISRVGDRIDLSFTQADVGRYDRAEVDYRGWWTLDGLENLARVVPLSISLNGFLDRTVDLVKLWESVQEAPLRNIVTTLGLERTVVSEFWTAKLLGTLCQLATICKDGGHRWPEDVSHVKAAWDKEFRIPAMRCLFALNALRQKAAHRTGSGFDASLAVDLETFGIERAAQAAGWAGAVDTLYDRLAEDLQALAWLIRPNE